MEVKEEFFPHNVLNEFHLSLVAVLRQRVLPDPRVSAGEQVILRMVTVHPSNPDTNGTEESVLFRQGVLISGVKLYANYMGEKVSLLERGVLISGVSLGGSTADDDGITIKTIIHRWSI